jgi:hypothetical protein
MLEVLSESKGVRAESQVSHAPRPGKCNAIAVNRLVQSRFNHEKALANAPRPRVFCARVPSATSSSRKRSSVLLQAKKARPTQLQRS